MLPTRLSVLCCRIAPLPAAAVLGKSLLQLCGPTVRRYRSHTLHLYCGRLVHIIVVYLFDLSCLWDAMVNPMAMAVAAGAARLLTLALGIVAVLKAAALRTITSLLRTVASASCIGRIASAPDVAKAPGARTETTKK